MRDSEPTAHEALFFGELQQQVSGLQDWYHEDPDGSPWMTVSYDFTHEDNIYATLRLDYDGHGLRGGWSPACLNWDDGVRADEALIETGPPDGLRADGLDPIDAAALGAAWFRQHIERRTTRPLQG